MCRPAQPAGPIFRTEDPTAPTTRFCSPPPGLRPFGLGAPPGPIPDLPRDAGPRHLHLPLDVQSAPADQAPAPTAGDLETTSQIQFTPEPGDLIILGPEAAVGIDGAALAEWADRRGIVLATTFSGRGAFPEGHAGTVGHLGIYARETALAAWTSARRVLLAAVDPALLSDLPPAPLHLLRPTVLRQAFTATAGSGGIPAGPRFRAFHRLDPSSPITPAALAGAVATSACENGIVVCDAGTIRHAAATALSIEAPGCWFVSERQAPLGWGLCAAIGAAVARPEEIVHALVGDGALQMHGMELATAQRNRIPLIVVVSANGVFGAMHARADSAALRAAAQLPRVDWGGLCASLGVESASVATQAELEQALIHARNHISMTPSPFVVIAATEPPHRPPQNSRIRWMPTGPSSPTCPQPSS